MHLRVAIKTQGGIDYVLAPPFGWNEKCVLPFLREGLHLRRHYPTLAKFSKEPTKGHRRYGIFFIPRSANDSKPSWVSHDRFVAICPAVGATVPLARSGSAVGDPITLVFIGFRQVDFQNGSFLVPEAGFEPTHTDSESAAIPIRPFGIAGFSNCALRTYLEQSCNWDIVVLGFLFGDRY